MHIQFRALLLRNQAYRRVVSRVLFIQTKNSSNNENVCDLIK